MAGGFPPRGEGTHPASDEMKPGQRYVFIQVRWTAATRDLAVAYASKVRLLGSLLRKYTVVRREAVVERIEDALVASGASIVMPANPRSAPFEITIRTPTGATLDLVCYAFTANGYRRAGRPDRHHFRITYGGGADRCHQLYFDPDGKRTTLLFGVHVEMDLFVGVDPRMHSPTRFPRSVELKKGDLETARAHRWHGWERER